MLFEVTKKKLLFDFDKMGNRLTWQLKPTLLYIVFVLFVVKAEIHLYINVNVPYLGKKLQIKCNKGRGRENILTLHDQIQMAEI